MEATRNHILKLIEQARPEVAIRRRQNPSDPFWQVVSEKLNQIENTLLSSDTPDRCAKLETSIAETVVARFSDPEDSYQPLVQLLCEIGNEFCLLGLPRRDCPIEEGAILHYYKYGITAEDGNV